MKKLNSKGFTHHVVMFAILALVLGAMGFAGYRVWQNSNIDAKADFTFGGCTRATYATVTRKKLTTGKITTWSTPYYQTLKNGSSGNCVRSLQRALNKTFCNATSQLTADGIYGPRTARAVYVAQGNVRGKFSGAIYSYRVDGSEIVVDGITGKQTWSFLGIFSSGKVPRKSLNCN